jgi:DNA uptake protein ComE-like DNA-binding protein
MNRHLFAGLSALALAACAADASDLAATGQALTAPDRDLAPECQGILDYASSASLAELDAFLPATVAAALVARRAEAPLATLADVLAVPGVGPARAGAIASAARDAGLIGDTCAGILEELALSTDDDAALVAFANGAGDDELRALGIADATVAAIAAGRPFAAAPAVAAVRGVGVLTFRVLRDAANAAASPGQFEILADAVNDAGTDVVVRTRFDWTALLTEDRGDGRLTSATCFGIDEDLLIPGTTVRPELATGAEVTGAITGAVRWADRGGALGIDTGPGLADLAARTDGKSFAGCYLRFEPDPWSGINRQFFVDTAGDFQVFSELRWSE